MSLAIVHTRAQVGVDAPLVTVEAHLSNGLPGLSIVGLPETAVKESKDRVRSALINSYFDFPARRITINLAPADLPKEGGRYDLAIALGILAASEQIPKAALADTEFIGELALSGELRQVNGSLPVSMACANSERALVVPRGNGDEAALCRKTRVYQAGSLLEVCAHLHERETLPVATPGTTSTFNAYPDLSEVKGQATAKRALEIAAAGGHNILFYGPPGTGKTMLASRLPGILPPLEETEALEAAAVASVASGRVPDNWLQRPFRSPHHTASAVAMVGGGSNPKPGEISLAHRGVLFLDELPEFQRQVLEVLREPLESGEICISRANAQVAFPARFQLVAAMNPCPCGYLGAGDDRCHCSPNQILRYRRRISGPLLDRFDLHVPVNAVNTRRFQEASEGESSTAIRARVMACRERQRSRQDKSNSRLSGRELERVCWLDEGQQELLETAMENLGLSARAYHRTLRVARTLADMEAAPEVSTRNLTEALSYRTLDRRKSPTGALV
ncbi:MAG: YifB family Mg chelatase-like AAA ATPase [Cellvibrionaceae bacterium]